MDEVTKKGFYTWNYYRYLFLYVLFKETGSLLRLIGLNFIIALLPVIILTIKSFWVLPSERIHFYGDAAIVIFCTTILITLLFKIGENDNDDLKPFKSSMTILIIIAYGLGLWIYIEYSSELKKDWNDFYHLCWISTLFLILTFIVLFYIHFTENIDFKSDVEPFINERKRKKIKKETESKTKTKSGETV